MDSCEIGMLLIVSQVSRGAPMARNLNIRELMSTMFAALGIGQGV